MNEEGKAMKHGKALTLVLAALFATACASGGGAAAPDAPAATGNQPRETAGTRQAGVHLVQAGMQEGEQAREQYQEALTDAMIAIEEAPMNPKAYLVAGQAAVGLQQYVQADTLLDRAVELYPAYEDQVEAEREQAWVVAYNEGAEALTAGDVETAIAQFEAADVIYQGRPEARVALGSVYAREGDVAAAAEAYTSALDILMADPPEGMNEEQIASWQESRRAAALNAAELLAQSGEFERAAEVLEGYLAEYETELDTATARRAQTALAGFYAQAGQAERAEQLYAEILGREDLTSTEYFQAGIGFFNTGEYEQAAEAFASAAELNPYSRDAWLNLVQSLYSQAVELEQSENPPEDELRALHQRVLESAEQVRELDPLNRNLVTFMLRSYRSLADMAPQGEAQELTQETQELFREYQSQPFEVSDLQLAMQGGEQARVTGTLTNLNAEAGTDVALRFAVLDQAGQVIDTAMIELSAPDQGSAVPFTATVDLPGGEFAGWRYELIE